MMTRELHGMHVTELSARTQKQLMKKLSKWTQEVDPSIQVITFDTLDDPATFEIAIVVWA